jgi:hypothetical protein
VEYGDDPHPGIPLSAGTVADIDTIHNILPFREKFLVRYIITMSACLSQTVYACQGCGKVAKCSSAIEYTATTPYPHQKWFCDLDCVREKHNSILEYARQGQINVDDEWTKSYLKALEFIQDNAGKCREIHEPSMKHH